MFGLFTWLKIGGVISLLIGGVLAINSAKNYIERAAENRIKVELLQHEIAEKDRAITLLETIKGIQEKTIEEREVKLSELEEFLKNITDNLGVDATDQAPDSIKEVIRRLGGR